MITSFKCYAHVSASGWVLWGYKVLLACAFLGVMQGCDTQKEGDKPNLSVVLSRVQYARGSQLSFLPVSAGTRFVPKSGMPKESERVLEKDGWLVFINEKPGHDWAHPFKIVFVPTGSETAIIVFDGAALPNFQLVAEGTIVTNKWLQY